jgi:hypothetical protein
MLSALIIKVGETMKTNTSHTQKDFIFPVGYHLFHKNKDINFQLNRFYSFGYWTKDDAEEAGNAAF